MRIRRYTLFALLLASLCICGCAQRSISDSGYGASSNSGARASNPFYQGELSEFDVLGITSDTKVTEAEIRKAAAQKRLFRLPKGSNLMLVQSGAMMPDDHMVKALSRYYNVSGFSGIPQSSGGGGYSAALRLAAAKAGIQKLVVYWGVLETSREDSMTKAVSWIPLIGGAIPDESQAMRIRLKVALVDVETGQWESFSPESFGHTASNGRYSRESSDQNQVDLLKIRAYDAAVAQLVHRYSAVPGQ